jgi:anti-sigma B factor antagonist
MDRDQPAAGIAIVALPAEIDIANADEICDLLRAALVPGIGVIVADLTGATFCDVSGVRALIRAQNDAVAAGAELRVAVPPGRVRMLLNLISPDGQLRVFPTAGRAAAQPTGPASL